MISGSQERQAEIIGDTLPTAFRRRAVTLSGDLLRGRVPRAQSVRMVTAHECTGARAVRAVRGTGEGCRVTTDSNFMDLAYRLHATLTVLRETWGA